MEILAPIGGPPLKIRLRAFQIGEHTRRRNG
jgi:hypothetical protein